MKFCAACGAALQGPSRFCVQCGAPAGATAPPTTGPGRPLPAPPTTPAPPTAASTAAAQPTVPVPRVAAPAAAPVSTGPAPSAELPPLQAARTHTQVNLPALVLSLLALALVAGGVTFLAMRDDGTSTPSASSTVSSVSSTIASVPTTEVPLDPAQQLAATRDSDHAAVEALVGQWVPQLSAKREGTEADGITYQLADIVALQSRLLGQYGALLLWSGDYVFSQGDVWVSVVPKGFATADEALAWCAAVPLDRDNCLAKLITHDPSIGDTAKLQP